MSPIKPITHIPKFWRECKDRASNAYVGMRMHGNNIKQCIEGKLPFQEVPAKTLKYRKKPPTEKQKKAWKKMAMSVAMREKIEKEYRDSVQAAQEERKRHAKLIKCVVCQVMILSNKVSEHAKSCDELDGNLHLRALTKENSITAQHLIPHILTKWILLCISMNRVSLAWSEIYYANDLQGSQII